MVLPFRGAALALAVVIGRARLNAHLGVLAVSVFGLMAYLLIPAFESQGAAAALTLSILVTAAVGAFQIRGTRVLPEARIGRLTLATAAAGLVLQLVGLSPLGAGLSAAVYMATLAALGVIRWSELHSLLGTGNLFSK